MGTFIDTELNDLVVCLEGFRLNDHVSAPSHNPALLPIHSAQPMDSDSFPDITPVLRFLSVLASYAKSSRLVHQISNFMYR